MKRFIGFRCSSPEFLAQSKRRENNAWVSKLQTTEKLKNNSEESYKI
jgi:hypothetical protein